MTPPSPGLADKIFILHIFLTSALIGAYFYNLAISLLVMMRLFSLFLFCLQVLLASDGVRHGRLDNGLSYYIKENETPKSRAVLTLAVKVGSLYEKPHEVGIAHFIEHLNFRGSKHFQDGFLMDYLSSLGEMRRNAYTGFDRTVYYLDIPLEDGKSLDQCLLFLHDFIGFATLEDKVIQKERHVVLDELHQGFSSVTQKTAVKLFAASFPSSLLATNFPAGSIENITGVTPETLRAFYKKWYRPDRSAIIIVGDLDGAQVEKKIKKLFNPLVNCAEKVLEPDLGVVFPEEDREFIHIEPESDQSGLILMFSAPLNPITYKTSEEWVKEKLISECVLSLLTDRLRGIQGPRLSGIQPSTYITVDSWTVEFGLDEGEIEHQIRAILNKVATLNERGFTASHLEEWIEEEKESVQKRLTKPVKRSHFSLIEPLVEHFISSRGIFLPEEEEVLLIQEILDQLTIEEVNGWFANSPFNFPYTAFLHTPKHDVFNSLKEKGFLLLDDYSAQEEESGSIENVEVQSHSGVFEWTLSNGMRVLLKNTDLDDDKVHVHMVAKGGLAQFSSSEDRFSAAYSPYGLKRYLDVKVEMGYRSLSQVVDKNEVVSLLRAVHALFKEPLNTSAIKKELYFSKWEEKKKKSPTEEFEQKILKVMGGDHHLLQEIDLGKVDPLKAKEAYEVLFGRPQDFTLILVGDFDPKELVEPISQYIASLPEARPKKGEIFPNGPLPFQGIQEVEFAKGNQTFATCVFEFPFDVGPIHKKYESYIPIRGVCHLLEKRLWSVLRSEHGKTYGVRAKLELPFVPYPELASIRVEFTCQPQDRHHMTDLALEEIRKLKEEGITARELSNLKALFYEEQREGIQDNDYWVSMLSASVLYGTPLPVLFDPKRIDRLVTSENIHQTALRIFAHPNYGLFYHLPGGASPK